ncbi:hypothetical protein OKA04_19465 [Luteolibacter flavescens]|uniref:PEP-CTERM protein-sorting domain-containing protein n=1 Tax=Luteolibacter flavescens TaxID=1859460 RepID=A0ABT3FTP3_9BACT|nr:hypothetical protein [Luteolibacter flavescens]MCW1886928.1 hypothetical protein [Luteolibacter flavescens]
MALLAMRPATAAVTLFNVPSHTTSFEAHGDGMVGFTFQVLTTVTVTSVGWYDHDADGLSQAYQVGLWSSSTGFQPGQPVEALLGTSGVTIPAAGTLEGSWRVLELSTALVLQPGVSYQLAGLDSAASTDPIRYISQVADEYSNEFTSVGQFFYHATGTPSEFGVTTNDRFYLASGFQLGPMLFTNVPEPSSCALAAIGLTAVLLRNRQQSVIRR